jgi:hypothetical protein
MSELIVPQPRELAAWVADNNPFRGLVGFSQSRLVDTRSIEAQDRRLLVVGLCGGLSMAGDTAPAAATADRAHRRAT